jgi:hypothetical protein
MRPSLLASTFTLLLLSTAPFAWADDATHALEESLRLLSAPVQGCIDPQKGPLRATPLSEPEICRDPMKAVCENSPPPTIQLSESEIRARVNQALNKEDRKNTNFYGQFAQEINLIITKLRSGEPVDPKQLTGALSTYSRILNKTQDEIMTQFLKFGVTRRQS